jgi:hypothetical protein
MSEFNFDGLGIEELLFRKTAIATEKAIEKAIETKENGTNTDIKELTNKVEALDDSFFMLSMKRFEFMEQEPKVKYIQINKHDRPKLTPSTKISKTC